MTDAEIREIFLANGFTIKDGLTDLKPYVYEAARALLEAERERWCSDLARLAEENSKKTQEMEAKEIPESACYYDGVTSALKGFHARLSRDPQ